MTFPTTARSRLAPLRWISVVSLVALVMTLGTDVTFRHHARGSTPVAPQATSGPNILIIVTDDQRIGTMSVMPQARYWFNETGTKFTRAYANTPQCCPSRSSLMTGQYSHNHGVVNNAQTANLDQESTVQRYLHDSGYRTALFGKFLNSWKGSPLYFDRWAMNNGSHRYFEGKWNVDGTVQTIDTYSTDYIAEKTLEFLHETETQDEQPWYAYVSTLAPHTPAVPEPDYSGAPVSRFDPNPAMLEKSRKDKPGYVRHSEADLDNASSTRTSQMRTLMSVDDLVADVLTEMGNLEELDNTLAVFMSDNGFLWAEHGMLGPTASKSNPYTASIKIPLSLRWPGHILEGGIDSRQVSIVDLLPTILEATGVAPDPTYPLDGSSLLQTDWSRSRIFTEYQHTPKTKTPSWASIRTPEYQYIETYGWGDIGTSPEVYGDSDDEVIQFREYYYLKSDRWQNHNVLADKRLKNDPDVASLHRMLTRDRRCKGSTCP